VPWRGRLWLLPLSGLQRRLMLHAALWRRRQQRWQRLFFGHLLSSSRPPLSWMQEASSWILELVMRLWSKSCVRGDVRPAADAG